MAILLSPAQIAQIKSALHDVTDTFCTTEVLYQLYKDSIDRYNEGKSAGTYTVYNLKALAEYRDNDSDYIVKTPSGAILQSDIKLTFNYQDLDELGLITTDLSPVFRADLDWFTANGDEYRCVYVGMDGPLDEKQVLVVIHGELKQKKA